MKFVILACFAAVAFAAPQYSSSEEAEFIPILKDDRVHEEDGTYSFDFETANGISFSQAGSPDGDEDAVIKAGEYSYTAPDGTEIHLRFVADDNGFQPEGDHLPVAPEFPTRSLSSSSTRSPSPPRRTPPLRFRRRINWT
nr:cuticle protein CP14.6-like [Penaeus vannamei]